MVEHTLVLIFVRKDRETLFFYQIINNENTLKTNLWFLSIKMSLSSEDNSECLFFLVFSND